MQDRRSYHRVEENPFLNNPPENDGRIGRRRPEDSHQHRPQLENHQEDNRRQNHYDYPTNPQGNFAQAMSAIACNAEAGAKGVFDLVSQGNDSFREQVSQALALKLNLKTNQQANEKVLLNLLKSKGQKVGLKQMLQARAAVYGTLLDPA